MQGWKSREYLDLELNVGFEHLAMAGPGGPEVVPAGDDLRRGVQEEEVEGEDMTGG